MNKEAMIVQLLKLTESGVNVFLTEEGRKYISEDVDFREVAKIDAQKTA